MHNKTPKTTLLTIGGFEFLFGLIFCTAITAVFFGEINMNLWPNILPGSQLSVIVPAGDYSSLTVYEIKGGLLPLVQFTAEALDTSLQVSSYGSEFKQATDRKRQFCEKLNFVLKAGDKLTLNWLWESPEQDPMAFSLADAYGNLIKEDKISFGKNETVAFLNSNNNSMFVTATFSSLTKEVKGLVNVKEEYVVYKPKSILGECAAGSYECKYPLESPVTVLMTSPRTAEPEYADMKRLGVTVYASRQRWAKFGLFQIAYWLSFCLAIAAFKTSTMFLFKGRIFKPNAQRIMLEKV